jgi:4'-phosphopantetheinyl transferase
LSQIGFAETKNGRPYVPGLPGLWFSFSSSRFGLLGAWSSTHGIGVDLEDPSRNLDVMELAHRYFSKAEAKVVERLDGPERLQTFLRFWTLKEAALKSMGEGLPFGIDAFEFELELTPRVVRAPSHHGGPVRFDAHVIEGTLGCASLVIAGRA